VLTVEPFVDDTALDVIVMLEGVSDMVSEIVSDPRVVVKIAELPDDDMELVCEGVVVVSADDWVDWLDWLDDPDGRGDRDGCSHPAVEEVGEATSEVTCVKEPDEAPDLDETSDLEETSEVARAGLEVGFTAEVETSDVLTGGSIVVAVEDAIVDPVKEPADEGDQDIDPEDPNEGTTETVVGRAVKDPV
jgi:hypothetical protein